MLHKRWKVSQREGLQHGTVLVKHDTHMYQGWGKEPKSVAIIPLHKVESTFTPSLRQYGMGVL